jgi:cytochrome P450 family 6
MTLSFVSYNLAIHTDYQEELYNEITSILERYYGIINYESANDMKFMDMVIDETLRPYPLVDYIDRETNKDYEYCN